SAGDLFASGNCSQIVVTTSKVITTCQDITVPGNYFLQGNLMESQPNTTCLRIHDTRNVQLDCKSNTVVGDGSPAISVTSVQGFSLSNCTLQNTAVGGNTRVLEVNISSDGIISGNTIGNLTDQLHFFVRFDSVNSTAVINNTIDAQFDLFYSKGNI